MSKQISVHNLSPRTTGESLLAAFAAHGQVVGLAIPTDRETGLHRGLAFVTMSTDEEADAAIAALNGTTLDGRPVIVQVHEDRDDGRMAGDRPGGGAVEEEEEPKVGRGGRGGEGPRGRDSRR